MFSLTLQRFKAWSERHFIGLVVWGVFALFVLAYFAENIFVTIPPGFGGALWLRFFGGTVLVFHYGEGTKLIFPWDRIYLYDLRVQQRSRDFDVLTNEGLQIAVDVTLRFRLNPRALGEITAFAGPDFVDTLVIPSVGATVRQIAAEYNAVEIYSTKRKEIENIITEQLETVVENLLPERISNEIVIEDLWFRSITLPADLKAAIEAKLVQQQVAEQYRYILDRESQERRRKIIEAQGIKDFQDIVSSGISDNFLRWKGIDATLKLAQSPNSKVVIIGGKDGMPLILGPLDSGTGFPLAPERAAPAPAASMSSSPTVEPPVPGQVHEPGPPSGIANPYLRNDSLPAVPLPLDPNLSVPPPPP